MLDRDESRNSGKPVLRYNEREIDSLCSELNQSDLPGVAVGIAIRGEPVYRKGFGLASLELPVALTPSMRMRIGSVTKHFTAFAYLLLCEEGEASIDDSIGKYLPELHPITHCVTMRQLMGNISGLREATDLAVQFSGVEGHKVTTADLLSFYRDVDDANAPPGSTFIYNNGGWVILTAVIERITGQSLEQVLCERVFKPIRMFDTVLRRWDDIYIPNSASSHALDATGSYKRTEYVGGIDYAGAGAIASTVDDMLRWMAHMDMPQIGTAATWQAMKTPLRLRNGTSTGYSLGLITSSYRGVETLWHAGGGFGSNAQMLKVPAAALDIVVMVNRSDMSSVDLVEGILDACLTDLDPPQSSSCRPPVKGLFQSAKTGRVVQFLQEDTVSTAHSGLQTVSIDGHRIQFARTERDVLRPAGAAGYVKYSLTLIGDPTNPRAVQLNDFGNVDELTPLKPVVKGNANEIVGRFCSESTGTQVTIFANDNRVQLRAQGRFGVAVHHLECLAESIWRSWADNELALPPWGLLAFDAGGDGFAFYNHLTRNLRFRRIS